MSASTVDARTRRSVTIILLVASFISLASQTMMVTAQLSKMICTFH